MHHLVKKWLAVGLATALLGGMLAACGNTTPENSTPDSHSTAHSTTTSTATDTTTAKTTNSAAGTSADSSSTATETPEASSATSVTASATASTTTTTTKTTSQTTMVTTTTTTSSATTTTTSGKADPANIHQLRPNKSYIARAKKLFSVRSADSAFAKIQGGYFDGETWYVATIRKLDGGYEDVRLLVVSKTGTVLRESQPLALDHANNITYNPDIDRLVITHCSSPDGHFYRYSLVDPKTLTVTKTEDKEQPFFAMAYSPEKKQYASARWGGETLDFWDKDMHHQLAVNVEQPKSLSQGVFCDAQGVYFVRSSQNGAPSELRIYDWAGQLTRTMRLVIPGNYEPECINIVDNIAYVIADDWQGNAIMYSLYFEEV